MYLYICLCVYVSIYVCSACTRSTHNIPIKSLNIKKGDMETKYWYENVKVFHVNVVGL